MFYDIGVRDFITEDLVAIAELIDELGYPTTLDKISDRFNKIVKDNHYKTLIAEINGDVVGFIGLCKLLAYEESGCYVRIIALVVSEQYRNYGVGTKLINSAERWAGCEGAFAITLDSGIDRKNAHAFYNNRGYKIKDYGFVKML